MSVNPEAIKALNAALDRKRELHKFQNDIELALHLKMAPKTLSQIRNGKWTRMQEALIGVLTGHQPNGSHA